MWCWFHSCFIRCFGIVSRNCSIPISTYFALMATVCQFSFQCRWVFETCFIQGFEFSFFSDKTSTSCRSISLPCDFLFCFKLPLSDMPVTRVGHSFGDTTNPSLMLSVFKNLALCLVFSVNATVVFQVLWVLQAQWFRWILIIISVVLSGTVLVNSMWPAVKNDRNRMVNFTDVHYFEGRFVWIY